MSTEEKVDFDEERIQNILLKSATDDQFRQSLISNPRSVLAENGAEFSGDVDFKVVEVARNELLIPLPPFVGDQLQDEQLEAVAGGIGWSGSDVKEVLIGFSKVMKAFYSGLP